MTGFWTPVREQELADLVAGGKSAAQIAAVLGCSRNAVIGKGRFGMLDGWASRRGRVEVRPRAAKPIVDAPSLVPADPLPEAPIPERAGHARLRRRARRHSRHALLPAPSARQAQDKAAA